MAIAQRQHIYYGHGEYQQEHNLKDPELTRAYRVLMTCLSRAGIFPVKHILENEVSESMKDVICDKYTMQMELTLPGCHRRNAAKVAIQNFKAPFLSILTGVTNNFLMQ